MQLYKPLQPGGGCSHFTEGIYTATVLHVRFNPGVLKVHNKNVSISINKRRLN